MASPSAIITEPNIAVQRTPYRSASQPMPMPPTPAPNQASDDAKAGTERAPPVSAAIVFNATTAIHGPPNATARIASAMLATTHEARDSMLGVIRRRRQSRRLAAQ